MPACFYKLHGCMHAQFCVMHTWRAFTCHWKHVCNEANGWKLIAALLTSTTSDDPFEWGTVFGNGGLVLAAKTGPPN